MTKILMRCALLTCALALTGCPNSSSSEDDDKSESDSAEKKKKKRKKKKKSSDKKTSGEKDASESAAPMVLPAAVKQLMAGADCKPMSEYALRTFCAAIEPSPTLVLPATAKSLPGMTVAVTPNKTPKRIALETTHFTVLHLDGTSARVTTVKPDNEAEKKELFATVLSVAGYVRGDNTKVTVPSGLQKFIDSERTKPRLALTKTKSFATFKRAGIPAELYQSERGPTYVVVEHAGEITYVSVFPNPR